MGILENMNERVKKFSIFDVKLAQGIGIFVALIFAKLIPEIMDINIWWFVALLVICAIKPVFMSFSLKNSVLSFALSSNRQVSGYGASHLRPNPSFARTSDTRQPLYALPIKQIRGCFDD